MRFKKIKFNNYRCFLDGELQFEETEGKNINLIIGTNGAGKTEILFAFWWVLYGFNFKSLKNKEATPYALNSSIYKEIQNGSRESANCSVQVEIEDAGVTYVVERTAEFKKTAQSVSSKEYQSIRYYKPNHELSLPIRDEAEVNKQLTRIVPKAILNGIVFDGERMKQLSSVDETSVKAIAGVINDITNVELIEQCKITFEQIQRKLNKDAKKLAKQNGNVSLSELISEIDRLQEDVNKTKTKRSELLEKITSLRMQAQELSLQLDDIKEARLLEAQRKDARTELEKEESQKATCIHNFMVSICDGYLMCSEPIFADVEKLLKDYDVPAELTVPAVNNILIRPTCICGNEWTDKMRKTLETLRENLPPDNINSAMGEKVHQLRIQSTDKRKAVKSDFDALKESNEKIKRLKDRIASLSIQITKSGSEAAEEIEKRYEKIQQDMIDASASLQNIDDRLPDMEKELESKKKIKSAMSQSKDDSIKIDKESAFVEKCILALEQLNRVNRMTALQQINKRLQEAYEMLCDDYNLGRRIYIVQYDDNRRFQLITYFEEKYQEKMKSLVDQGRVKSMKSIGFSDEEIQETAIISCAQSNSTGQSKMNTLAFVKAILDYANDPHREELFEVTKEYPLLIDAPFGDIFDKNLEKSAETLHLFTHQIILMLAKESYGSVSDYISPYVSTVHLFTKEQNEDHSNVLEIALEAI